MKFNIQKYKNVKQKTKQMIHSKWVLDFEYRLPKIKKKIAQRYFKNMFIIPEN